MVLHTTELVTVGALLIATELRVDTFFQITWEVYPL